MPRRQQFRGVTLVEVLITVALIAFVTVGAATGLGLASGARLKRSATMIAGAVRVAYAHANAKSKPVRLVFDFDERMVVLEESTSGLVLDKNDKTGGAAAATEAEREAQEAAEAILKGPRAPRPSFQPTKAFGFNPDKDKPGKELPNGIRFLQVETGHEDEPENTGRAYLYFWPGGQTERAAVALVISGEEESEDSVMTILVSPLTGKTELKKGKVGMPRPRNDGEESEREDTGF
jgi:general secretion pathway protein H